ncbi:hypothetical protein [Streptosporangium sp. CA-115845]
MPAQVVRLEALLLVTHTAGGFGGWSLTERITGELESSVLAPP